jgi:hypothetical protein
LFTKTIAIDAVPYITAAAKLQVEHTGRNGENVKCIPGLKVKSV